MTWRLHEWISDPRTQRSALVATGVLTLGCFGGMGLAEFTRDGMLAYPLPDATTMARAEPRQEPGLVHDVTLVMANRRDGHAGYVAGDDLPIETASY